MKILVTGGCGFIGCNLTEQLVQDGYDVTVYDDYSLGRKENLPVDIPVFNTSLSQINHEFNVIFHLGIPSSSPMYKENNMLVGKSINEMISLLNYCRRHDAKLIYASSSSLYNGNSPPFHEDMPIHVTDYYTECRFMIERLAKLYSNLYNIESVGLRFFSVYGPHERHKGVYANIATQFMWLMQENKAPMIYGDGCQTRDFTHVYDVVDALTLAMKHKGACETFNVGTGEAYSFNMVFNMLNGLLGLNLKAKYRWPNPIKNYVQNTLADTSKAEQRLGFKAHIKFEHGLQQIIQNYIGDEKDLEIAVKHG